MSSVNAIDASSTVVSVPLPAARRAGVIGAVFLMATSAIGPGFITQTAKFTLELQASFACAILLSVLVDVAVQSNVWRVVGVSGERAHLLCNRVVPGAGYVLSALIVLGGLIFSIGNVSGCGLGLDAMLGLDPKLGAAVSAVIAIGVFVFRRAGLMLDRVVIALGLAMLLATLVSVLSSQPPLREVVVGAFMPSRFDPVVVTTIIGGTIGGYISYAGVHRLLDSGQSGIEHVPDIQRSAVSGILLTGVMRTLLFLAVFGVLSSGATLDATDPAGSAFRAAAGNIGQAMFGVVLWAAALSSVIGASYTSVSFMTSPQTGERTRTRLTIAFIAIATTCYLLLQQTPLRLLVLAGTVNGLILPFGVGLLLWIAWRRQDLLHGYRYPIWLLVIGALTWLLTLYLGYGAIQGLRKL